MNEINANTEEAAAQKSCKNHNLTLVLEASDDEDLFKPVPTRDDSIEIDESNHGQDISNNDTPEIEDLIADAEDNEMPEYILKTMQDFKKRKDQVFVID